VAKAHNARLWTLFNTASNERAFPRLPISNWTRRLDVWLTSSAKDRLPSLYYAHQRTVVERKGLLVRRPT
jgi:sulfate adenylyltransferase subunit 2